MKDDEFDGDLWEELDGDEFLRRHSSRSSETLIFPYTVEEWLSRELPPPDRLLGAWMTTTSRILLAADTGLGKTNLCMALAAHAAAGENFLHWRARRQAKVLYIDGEMSRGLYQCRIADTVRRLGCRPDTWVKT
jgi:RecA-family ATPase